MKIYVSFKYSGEDLSIVRKNIKTICDILEDNGYETSCTLWLDEYFEKNNFTQKDIMEYALKEIDSSDINLAFINSKQKSEGMLLELGYSIAKEKKIYLIIKEGIPTSFLKEFAEKVIVFKNLKDLESKLEDLTK